MRLWNLVFSMALLESHCVQYHFKYVPQKLKFTVVFISQVNLTTQYYLTHQDLMPYIGSN